MPNRLSQYCEGVMEAGWLLAVIVTPLFFNIYSSRVFEPDKIALLRSLALVVLAAWLVKLIYERGPRFENIPAENTRSLTGFFRLPLIAPVSALAAVYIIATLLSISPQASLFGSYQRLQGTFTTFSYLILFAAIVGNVRRRAQVERLLTTVVLTSLPISLYGIVQHYHLDSLPWGGDTVTRVAGNMGNAIFLAAYLIMSILIILGRVATTFHAILTEAHNYRRNMVRATIYVFCLALNLVAFWFANSRGPMLGLFAGLFFFFILLALYWRVRMLALSTIGLTVLLGAFLLVLNLPNGPLVSVRESPTVIGRLGHILDEIEGRTGTGQVRILIASGVVKLVQPHPPIEYPDGEPDRWNLLRPIIGYGPESLLVAYNRFYPPALGQLESRTASPDRSHNETFDALAFTGLLGLGVYLALFVAVFYYSLKWLGLVETPRRRNALIGLILGTGAISAIGFVLWQGPEFFGVGLPFGMLVGLIIFMTLHALLAGPNRSAEPTGTEPNPSSIREPWRAIGLISLAAAVVAHFTEIHFGIAIVSTRTHFWIFTALLMVLGFVFPRLAQPVAATTAAQTAPTETASTSTAQPRRKHRVPRRSASSSATRETWGPMAVGVGLMLAVLFTLGFDFITNATRTTNIQKILADSFIPVLQGKQTFGILGLILLTWLVGGTMVYLEEMQNARGRQAWAYWGAHLGLVLVLSGILWLLWSARLASNVTAAASTIEMLVASAEKLAGVMTFYYGVLLVIVLGLAAALSAREAWTGGAFVPSGRKASLEWVFLELFGYVGLPLAALLLVFVFNLQVIQADIVYKVGLQFEDQGQAQIAIPLYQRANALSPGEDYYYLFLGRAFLSSSSAMTDPAEREKRLQEAEDGLLAARKLNPLNTDHTANLARLNRQWALLESDPTIRAQKAETSNNYYQQALSLSPNSVVLMGEWAALSLQVLEDPETTQARLEKSLSIDDTYEQTYQLQGDLYVWRARHETDATKQQDYYQKAIAVYLEGIEVASHRQANVTNMRVGLASAYIATQQLQPAIDEYRRLLEAGAPGLNKWQVYQAIAELYRQLGDNTQAKLYAQQALDSAPEDKKAEVQGWFNGFQ
jgi:tetratricopeptide (TPR) repeat protein